MWVRVARRQPDLAASCICRTRSGGARGVRSGRCSVEGGDSDEVVDGGLDLEAGPVSLSADVAQLASSPMVFIHTNGFSTRLHVRGETWWLASGGATKSLAVASTPRTALARLRSWCALEGVADR